MSSVYKDYIKEHMCIRDIYSYLDANVFVFYFLYNYLVEEEIELPEWLADDESAITLDMEYCLIHSGDKKLSTTFYRIAKASPDDEALWQRWCWLIYSKFKDKWNKIYSAMMTDYNPLENYDSNEEISRTGDDKISNNVNLDTKGYNKSFNSADLEEIEKTHSEGNATNNYSKTDYNSKVTTKKHGNIGVTTSQQMLESEIDLRSKYNFYNIIMNDVDSMLTTNLY